MKHLVFVVLIIATVVGKEVANAIGLIASKRAFAGNCKPGQRQSCADCSTVNICSYDQTVVTKYRCMDVDPSRPYCKEGECSTTVDPKIVCSPNDLCPIGAPGYYPDPTNCTRFLYCDQEANGFPQTCLASSNVYSQSTVSCFLKKRSSDCFQVDCKNAKNIDKWFLYTPFPQVYFFCSANGPLIFKCPGKNDIFDVNTRRCEFQCPSTGRFEYPRVDYMFYECVQVTTSKIEKFVQYCPGTTMKFIEEKQQCA